MRHPNGSLALRVPLDLATYDRLARAARDAGLTLEAHAARLLVGVVGGERWTDPIEVPERAAGGGLR